MRIGLKSDADGSTEDEGVYQLRPYAASEKALGKGICSRLTELTRFDPYFAENQTFAGRANSNIFRVLNGCVGLIAVMHPRGAVARSGGFRIHLQKTSRIAIVP